MKLLVVIVNYRTARLTVECLHSMANELPSVGSARVVVVDNASGDRSCEYISKAIHDNAWREWVSLRALEHNGGFAAGNNAAIREALDAAYSPDYVLLLNPDTVVKPGALDTLLRFMEGHQEVGLAGAGLEDGEGNLVCSAFRFPGALGELEAGLRMGAASRLLKRWAVGLSPGGGARKVDWVAGACLIVRRKAFETVGLLDEGFFLYYEEVDFCLRAQRGRWECWYVPDARVTHLAGQSTGVTDPTHARTNRRPAYWFASRGRYYRKHHGPVSRLLADVAFALAHASYRVRRGLIRKPIEDPPGLLADFIRERFGLLIGRAS